MLYEDYHLPYVRHATAIACIFTNRNLTSNLTYLWQISRTVLVYISYKNLKWYCHRQKKYLQEILLTYLISNGKRLVSNLCSRTTNSQSIFNVGAEINNYNIIRALKIS